MHRDLDGSVEGTLGRIDVDDQQIRPLQHVHADRRRMELERRLVAEPQERRPVVADDEVDVSPGAGRGDPDRADPLRRVRRHRLLEVLLAADAVRVRAPT